jgi:hypothetical protein
MVNQPRTLSVVIDQDGAAILDRTASTITTLNPCGAFIWEALSRNDSPASIAEQLSRETGEPLSNVKADVDLFLSALKECDLLPHGTART